ncbi:glycosyltransferase family 4 protein [Dysgonomonas sp. 520]|uniref:glycosyltransferase family 4 protein n=1 Tax=Dysgonomonas sp. 520 TaxID=2302931 RepID=UPI0013D399B1|nr:glycosyltransferase family 4 protein [Dysgonomonas sp. 520]NDW08894.1 glycosyltransferase family 1 protein [Dysgonomonas sp. 520]
MGNSEKKIKVGFLAMRNPQNKAAWSGTIHQLYENIKANDVEISWIPVSENKSAQMFNRIVSIFTKLLKKKKSPHFTYISKQLARSVDLDQLNQVDIVFSPAGSVNIAYLKTNKPILYLTDTTFKLMYSYYPEFSNFMPCNVMQGNKLEKISANKAWRIISASDWCSNSLINDYGVDSKKIKVLEFGANITDISLKAESRFDKNNTLNLLFLGVGWKRKGGDIAVDCVKSLNEQGVKATLSIVGSKLPENHQNCESIKSYGFLNKNNEDEYQILKQVISESDLLILPTSAECAGIVFAEASAYGLPIFTYDTGGIPNYVINGKNGYRMNMNSTGKDFALKIKECIDNEEFETLKKGCLEVYHEKLNWTVWQKKFQKILDEYRKEFYI